MPYIEEKMLDNLHSQIETVQRTNNELLAQVKTKQRDFRQVTLVKRLYQLITFTCLATIGALIFVYYKYPEYILGNYLVDYFNEVRKTELLTENNTQLKIQLDKQKENFARAQANIKELEEHIVTTFAKDSELLASKEAETSKNHFEAAESYSKDFDDFFANKTVYSVQIGFFKTHNLLPYSKSFQNFKGHKWGSMYSYSIGNFLTREEAENFRKALINLGFKDAYLVTYKNGELQK